MQHKVLMIVLSIFTALILVACDTTGNTESSVPELSQTFESQPTQFVGSVSINYPDGWFVSSGEASGGNLANREPLVENPDQELEAGDISVAVGSFPAFNNDDRDPEQASLDLLNGILGEVSPEGDIEVGEAENVTIDGRTVAKVTGTNPESDFAMYALGTKDATVYLVGTVASGDLEGHLPLIEAMVASIQYEPNDTPPTFDEATAEPTAEVTEQN